MKANKRLQSEQLPNDGGWHLDRLMDEANKRLKESGKPKKTATIKRSGKKNIALQFNFGGQKNKGIGQRFTKEGIQEAERLARIVSCQLEANQFTWEWFDSLLGKPVKTAEEKQLTCEQMLEEYKTHFFKERKHLKRPEKAWYSAYRHLEKVICENKGVLNAKTIKTIVEATDNNTSTRRYLLNGLSEFLGYHDISKFDSIIEQYKKNNNPKPKKRKTPDTAKIIDIYNTGFEPKLKCSYKNRRRHPQWQFLYGLLATYGLRVHEAWNIANWDKPVTLKDGDWVSVVNENDEDVTERYSGKDTVIPAMLDSDNEEHILCIGHDTKTGYRMAMPLSPEGHDWVQEFNLLQPLNLPDIENPLGFNDKNKSAYKCANQACSWFLNHEYGFTPHDLRHAYNHRGRHLDINLTALCQSLGHGMQMNSTTYLNTMPDSVKAEVMVNTIRQEKEKRNELEIAQDRIKELETRVKELETELKMYKAISSNKSS